MSPLTLEERVARLEHAMGMLRIYFQRENEGPRPINGIMMWQVLEPFALDLQRPGG